MNKAHQGQTIAAKLQALPQVLWTGTTSEDNLRKLSIGGLIKPALPGRYVSVKALPQSDTPKHLRREKLANCMLAAGITKLRHNEVLSHSSAAWLHGFPFLGIDARVHIIQADATGKGRKGVVRHSYRLEPEAILVVNGLRVTDLEQTALDLAAVLHPPQALAALDYARSIGADIEVLIERASKCTRRGYAKVRKLLAVSVDDTESVRESMCRYWVLKIGVTDVETQLPVPTTITTYFPDMAVKDVKVAIEYDGEEKYRSEEDVRREKRREDAIRAEGWDFIRVTRQDLNRPDLLQAQIRDRLIARGYKLANPSDIDLP